MVAKPIASGLMLVAIVSALGGAWWQQNAAGQAQGIRTADVSAVPPVDDLPQTAPEDVAEPDPEPVVDVAAEPEPEPAPAPIVEEDVAEATEPAEAPAEQEVAAVETDTEQRPVRVVDPAGFPAEGSGPIVTVNGRPLNTPSTPAARADTAAATPAEEAAAEPAEVAAVPRLVPPRPIPRPEGLAVAPRERIDYGTITATTGPGTNPDLPREPIARVVPEPIPQQPAYDPRQDGLVQVIGPDGQTLWLYEDQIDRYGGSRRVWDDYDDYRFLR